MQIGIFNGLLEDTLRAVGYEIFAACQLSPATAYLPISGLVSDEASAAVLGGCVDATIAKFLRRYCLRLLAEAPNVSEQNLDGLEIWTTLSSHLDDRVLIHVDNDEVLRKRSGRTRCPVFGSILYMGPGEGLENGGTFFVLPETPGWDPATLLFKPTSWTGLDPALKQGGLYVPFSPGRTVLFEGSLPHCIAPFSTRGTDKGPRVTLLVNGWSEPIGGGSLSGSEPAV